MWRCILLVSLLLLAACSNSTTTQPYDETKKMIVDALQSDDGKKALRKIFEDSSFRDLLVLEHKEVGDAINQTLLSKEAEDFWQQSFEQPKFKEAVAKTLKDQQEEILKSLMNDADYQKQLTAFFGQPESQKQLENILKGAVMRKELETIVKETIENPLMQTKWQKLIEESGKKEESKSGSGGESDKKEEK